MYHSITILGNLGRDPEMRHTPNGSSVCAFSVATSRSYKKGDEWIKETTWFRVSLWGKLAETSFERLHKGSKVLVVGRLTPDAATGGPRIWEATDGTSKTSFEVNATEVKFLEPKTDKQEEVQEEIPF